MDGFAWNCMLQKALLGVRSSNGSLCVLDCAHCGAVLTLMSLAQPSCPFVRVKLLLLWCGADSVAVACAEILARDLAQRSCRGISCRDLVQRSCQEISYRDLVQRPCLGISCRDLAKRSLTEIFLRDVF